MNTTKLPEGDGVIPVAFIPLIVSCIGGRNETAGKVPFTKDVVNAHPDAFAVRLSDDSMAPRYKPKEIVVTWPNADAVDGEPAVACLDDGTVTCRLWQESAGDVTLAALNPAYPSATYRRSEISWAWRVMWAMVEH